MWAVAWNMGTGENISSSCCTICFPHLCVFWVSISYIFQKPSTKYSLSVQGTSLISPSDLDKSEAWKQGNPDVSVMKWNSGAATYFQKSPSRLVIASVTASGHMRCLSGSEEVGTMAKCLSLVPLLASIWTTRLLVQGTLHVEGRFLISNLRQGKVLQIVLSLLSYWLWIAGSGGDPQYQQKIWLIVLLCRKYFHHIVNFIKMIHIYLYVILPFIFGSGIILMRILWNKT